MPGTHNPLLAKFRVYPKGKWFFFNVFIWKKRREMREALREAKLALWNRTEACVMSNRVINCRRGRNPRMTGLLGQIHFYEGSFRMGIITHEAGHAALAWARNKGVDVMRKSGGIQASKDEEEFCWVLGNIARQIVLRADEQWKYPASREAKVAGY